MPLVTVNGTSATVGTQPTAPTDNKLVNPKEGVVSGFIQSVFTNPFENVELDFLRSPYAGGLKSARSGFVITSDLWKLDNKALLLHAGPAEVSWTAPLRASSEDTKGGRAHYMSARETKASKTYFNIPTAQFTFQTGNIMPIKVAAKKPENNAQTNAQTTTTASVTGDVKATDQSKTTETARQYAISTPYGLQDFYYFLELINQDPLIPAATPSGTRTGDREGTHNYVWIFYTSLQFPKITLKGYFEPDGVSWQDAAETPTSFVWSANFSVYDSSPELWNAKDMVNNYVNFPFTLF